MKKVFVTGADGMLGSMICRYLLKEGYSVTAMTLPSSKFTTLDGLALEKVSGNILDKSGLKGLMQGHQYVIHVAAMTNVWPRRIEHLRNVNISGTMNVKEIASELGMERMVYIGSASSFTPGTKENPGNEDSAFSWNKFGMDYIDSKYEAQQLLFKAFEEENFPVIVVNPTFMIGPYDSGPSSGAMLLNLYRKKVPGYSEGGKNFVYSGDVAQAVVNALSMGRLGQCYIAGNENLEFREFFQIASNVMERKFNLKKVPQFLILGIGAMNSGIARIRSKSPKISYGMASMASVSQYFSVEKARKELNLPQTPIETAIKESLQWFKDNGYIS